MALYQLRPNIVEAYSYEELENYMKDNNGLEISSEDYNPFQIAKGADQMGECLFVIQNNYIQCKVRPKMVLSIDFLGNTHTWPEDLFNNTYVNKEQYNKLQERFNNES